MPESPLLPRRQRVAAYALITRGDEILLARISPAIAGAEQWTLPGGGIDFGEHPDDAVVREVYEETGLRCELGPPIWIGSAHRLLDSGAQDDREASELHSVRIVYEAWVAADAPEPRVIEVEGSTIDARWHSVAAVESGEVPTVPMVRQVLERHRPVRRQRLAAYALVVREDRLLLTRTSVHGPHPGTWTLPGGGVEHGESPSTAAAREVLEETGLRARVGALLLTHDEHFTGTAPHGREEDFHGIHLVFAATVEGERTGVGPELGEAGATTDAVAWVERSELAEGRVPVSDVVRRALAVWPGR